MNTASRMETNSAPNKIHLSDSTTHLLEPCGRFILESRGNISIKNRGDMVTSWLVGRKGEEHDNSKCLQNTTKITALKKISQHFIIKLEFVCIKLKRTLFFKIIRQKF